MRPHTNQEFQEVLPLLQMQIPKTSRYPMLRMVFAKWYVPKMQDGGKFRMTTRAEEIAEKILDHLAQKVTFKGSSIVRIIAEALEKYGEERVKEEAEIEARDILSDLTTNMHKDIYWQAGEIQRLEEELKEARDHALEEAARLAETECKQFAECAEAIRKLKTEREG